MDSKRLDRLEDKIDQIVTSVADINVNMAEVKKDLRYHIKRTDLLESQVKPISKHVERVHGGIKLVGLLSILAGSAEAVIKLIEVIK